MTSVVGRRLIQNSCLCRSCKNINENFDRTLTDASLYVNMYISLNHDVLPKVLCNVNILSISSDKEISLRLPATLSYHTNSQAAELLLPTLWTLPFDTASPWTL